MYWEYQTASFGIRPTPRVRSWTRQASYTCRYRLADIVPSRLPCGPNLVAAATAAACRRAGRNPCRSVVAVAPFPLSVRLELPGWKCSAGRDARSLGQARLLGPLPGILRREAGPARRGDQAAR